MSQALAGEAAARPGCSTRIPIIPVRYAVVPRMGAAFSYAPSGHKLETGFPALNDAAYTLRALRPGYVYVYMKGKDGEKLVIHEHDGSGVYRELAYRSLEDYGKRNNYEEGARRTTVWADACAQEVWIGYSTHLWTNQRTELAMSRKKVRRCLMQPLDMKELVSGDASPSKQEHVLPLDALTQWVEDYKPDDRRMDLSWSSHADGEIHTRVGAFHALAADYGRNRPRVPTVVALNDAEGVTLDLGLIAAARCHQAMDINSTHLASVAKPRSIGSQPSVPSCLKLDVENLHVASETFHRKNLVATLIEQTLDSMMAANGHDAGALTRLRQEGYDAQRVKGSAPRPTRTSVLIDERLSPAGARLAARLDLPAYEAFLRQREAAMLQLESIYQQIDRACADHDAWLATAESKHRSNPLSLAAALSGFDRDNRISATALEQSLALLMHGMGLPLPGRHDKDPRFKRLGQWIDDKDSPLYVALAAYNPFKDKADAVGSLLEAAGAEIEKLGGMFPEVYGATDLIAQNTTTVILHRMRGETRWDASSLRSRINAAAREANAQEVLGLLGARYRITDELTRADALSDEVHDFIAAGMAEMERTRSVTVTGSRTVTVVETQTLRIKPTIASLGKVQGAGALNAGLLYFNIINLHSAWLEVSRKYSHEGATNFASALFGTISALGTMAVSARTVHVATVARMSATGMIPGAGFGAGVARFLAGKLFGRVMGWPGILFGLATDWQKSFRLKNAGNSQASRYTFWGGAALAIGSAAILEGALAWSATSAAVVAGIPLAGWVVAAGLLLVAGGLWLMSRGHAQNHQPLELWAARSIFGNRMDDGESRDEVPRDAEDRPPPYIHLDEEIQGWYQARFAPLLLDHDQAEVLGWPGAESAWHENAGYTDSAEFTVLLPGYVMGQSNWSGGLSATREGRPPLLGALRELEVIAFGNAPEARTTPHGLLLRYQRPASSGKEELARMNLGLTYQPNQGLDEAAEIPVLFTLEDGWLD
ncbi:T6SS effector BTH_I2691 family protein [Lysobacter arvi]|uniref:T6SS effector BTH_I2691 family protein n=1 Tax=Lysobacter arvi TaxID=3038776 RepID=A0ABU1CE88_9GAMM|nr:T6SS effector BTH_I2691 family protein [Lysobacter arvi]MDR0183460.1 T6SS effector BTH_I2691 family protein [Lysobacter arvi]